MTLTASQPAAAPTEPAFHLFPLLPPELRLLIWRFSFLPRTVELHSRRTHYADSDRFHAPPKWHSRSRNPAALAVNVEARTAALALYTIALPLATPLGPDQSLDRPGAVRPSTQLLYLNLAADMVFLLGEVDFSRVTRLLEWFRSHDAPRPSAERDQPRRRRGLGRMAMSVASLGSWNPDIFAATLRALAMTLFADIDEFVMVLSTDRGPPPAWSGGRVVLRHGADTPRYSRFVAGQGRAYRCGDGGGGGGGGWMVVGRAEMKVAEVEFVDGW